ncbi:MULTISPECIES: hypothetical protein, partial [unclassified Microcoleus]|uniref:hypothetical protein n=1 Tax=unclassified Microcoleus TaxID=2642155 RepID=UPI001DCCE3B0
HKLEGLEGYLNVPLSPFWVGPNPRRFSPGEVQTTASTELLRVGFLKVGRSNPSTPKRALWR